MFEDAKWISKLICDVPYFVLVLSLSKISHWAAAAGAVEFCCCCCSFNLSRDSVLLALRSLGLKPRKLRTTERSTHGKIRQKVHTVHIWSLKRFENNPGKDHPQKYQNLSLFTQKPSLSPLCKLYLATALQWLKSLVRTAALATRDLLLSVYDVVRWGKRRRSVCWLSNCIASSPASSASLSSPREIFACQSVMPSWSFCFFRPLPPDQNRRRRQQMGTSKDFFLDCHFSCEWRETFPKKK